MMTSSSGGTSGNGKRTPADVLRVARQRESVRLRSHVLRTVDAMLARGDKITFATVQRAAKVSRWLVYQDEVGDYIRAAMQRSAGPDWLDDWDNDHDEALYE